MSESIRFSTIVKRSIWPLLGGTLVGILAFAPIGLAPGDKVAHPLFKPR